MDGWTDEQTTVFSDKDGGDYGDDDSGCRNYKEFRWETTDVGTTQLQRPRSLGQGQLTYYSS